MTHYKFIERGRTPEGIAFCILEDRTGKQVVSIDIETVWKAQHRKQRRYPPGQVIAGRQSTPYHKTRSKLRGDA